VVTARKARPHRLLVVMAAGFGGRRTMIVSLGLAVTKA
jgi:hypothetical protein